MGRMYDVLHSVSESMHYMVNAKTLNIEGQECYGRVTRRMYGRAIYPTITNPDVNPNIVSEFIDECTLNK